MSNSSDHSDNHAGRQISTSIPHYGNENFIPAAIRQWLSKNPATEGKPEIEASAPRDAGIVVVAGTASEKRAEATTQVLEAPTAKLLKDHERTFVALRRRLEAEVERARAELASLQSDLEHAQRRGANFEGREELLRDEIARVERALTSARERRRDQLEGGEGTVDSIFQLVVADQIQELRNTLRDSRRELEIALPEKRDEYERRVNETQYELEESKANLGAAESRLENLTKSRVSEPQRSVEPVGTGSTVIVALGIVLGAMLGVFAAFAAEFVAVARRRHEPNKGPGKVVSDAADATIVHSVRWRGLYAPFSCSHEKLIVMDRRSAQVTKYAANAMLATKISFMNEMANLAERLGADIESVRHGIGSDPRIGYHFIYAGLDTGTCLANAGNNVLCVDVSPERVERLRAGQVPIHEPGLEDIIARARQLGHIDFTTDAGRYLSHSARCKESTLGHSYPRARCRSWREAWRFCRISGGVLRGRT